jgi:hypothetical protein
MNKISYYILALLVAISLYSCEDVQTGPREPSAPWNAGPITEFTVTPINGGPRSPIPSPMIRTSCTC